MSDIEDQLRDIYGAEVSPALKSNITDKIMPQVQLVKHGYPEARALARTIPNLQDFLSTLHVYP